MDNSIAIPESCGVAVRPSWIARAIDSAVAAISPRAALGRRDARTKLQYVAALPTKDRQMAARIPFSPNSIRYQMDRVSLMFEARDLTENVGFAKGHLRKVQLYGAGTLAYEPDTGDAGMDSEITEYVRWWMACAHIGLKHTFPRLVQLALMGMTRDCDSLLVWVRDEDRELRLQLVEADQIGELFMPKNTPGYVSGVYLNSDGSRAGFHVYDRVGEMQYANPQIIEPWNANFFIDPMRMQERGITTYETCIQNIRDKFEILNYEKIIVKDISTTGIITYTQRGAADEFDFDKTETNSDGNVSFIKHAESGIREYMGIGEEAKVLESNRPSPTFQGFLKVLDTENCHGLNLPYGFLVDPSEPTGAGIRVIAHIANREFERIQNDVVSPILTNIIAVKLLDAAERRVISRHPNLLRGQWMFPPPPTADAERESDISIREVRAGHSTFTREYAEKGLNRRREWKIKKQEAVDRHFMAHEATQELRALGVTDTVSPDEIAAMSDNPQNDPDADGLISGDATKAIAASAAAPSNPKR